MSDATDGFRLAYDRYGQGPAVVLLHGWPGDRGDYRALVPRLTGLDVVVPDLRGFGESDKHRLDPAAAYSATAQARSVVALIEDLGLHDVVIAGCDIGSRILDADAQREFWYQSFHQLALAEQLIDGQRDAVRAYLAYFWSHWSGPSFELAAADLDRLVERYAAPGSFTASIGWYRAGAGSVARSLAEQPPPPAGRVHVPTTVLWPGHDPLFPTAWSDRLADFFDEVRLRLMPSAGHFSPLEAPDVFAEEIMAAAG